MPYQNSALSAGQLAMIMIVVLATLAAWLIAVFIAARTPPRGREADVAKLSPQEPAAAEAEHTSAA